MANLIVIFGPPASGKSAIGHELAALTGFRFFHNHVTIDPVATLLGWDHPRFWPTVREVRSLLLQTVASDPLTEGVIFTTVWALNVPEDHQFLEAIAREFTAQGGRVHFVELLASLEARLSREGTPLRIELKPFHRDVEAARRRQVDDERAYIMNTSGQLPLPYPHLRIDTEAVQPSEAAALVADYLRNDYS